jgi:hypothetical protein
MLLRYFLNNYTSIKKMENELELEFKLQKKKRKRIKI